MLHIVTSVGFISLCLLLKPVESYYCPTNESYNLVLYGCYKIVNGSNFTWSDASDFCRREISVISNKTSQAITHLVSIEHSREKSALTYWLKAYNIKREFWTDGIVSPPIWSWSEREIDWYLNSTELAISGNGTYFKISYDKNTDLYQVADDTNETQINYICEYQEMCNGSGSCQNNATCYRNFDSEVCICQPGYTGEYCETDIDECLKSPCLHGGICHNRIAGYLCNCSAIFFEGSNCETEKPNPDQQQRIIAFWSVIAIVCSIILLLSLSDLPWEDVLIISGCSPTVLNCCKKSDDKETMIKNALHISTISPDISPGTIKSVPMQQENRPTNVNYHVLTKIWGSSMPSSTITPHYDGYMSLMAKTNHDHNTNKSINDGLKQKPDEIQKIAETIDRIYTLTPIETSESATTTITTSDSLFDWTKQIKDELRKDSSRETSAGSKHQLISAPSPDTH